METTSLRERKKAQLRARLVEVSQRLFQEQGFDATTLDQICAEVDIVRQTLLRYFESKQHLALAPNLDTFERYRVELTSPERTEDVLTCWRRLVATSIPPGSEEAMVRYHRVLFDTPVLTAMLSAVNGRIEDLLTTQLAREAGTDPATDLYSRMLAALLVAGYGAVFRQWMRTGATEPLVPQLLRAIDIAEDAFPSHPSCVASRVRRNGTQTRRRAGRRAQA